MTNVTQCLPFFAFLTSQHKSAICLSIPGSFLAPLLSRIFCDDSPVSLDAENREFRATGEVAEWLKG
jgi:hypothetical protein